MTISAANKLAIYNGALLFIKERKLSALTDEIEARRLLDDVWDRGGIDSVLEHGQWNFAMRAAKLEWSPSVTPSFGYERAFEKPTDLMRLSEMCSDEFFRIPLLDYVEEQAYYFASLDHIFVRYVSNASAYGNDFSLWPENFKRYVEGWFGSQIVGKLTQGEKAEERAITKMHKLLIEAKSFDAMSSPTKFRPPGTWRRSRVLGVRGDLGFKGSLIE
jgi:hypothetical protein